MKRLLGILFSYSALTLSQSFADSGSKTQLSLEKCISIAISTASNVQRATRDKELNSMQLLQNYGQFLPDINLTSQGSYSSGYTLFTISGLDLINSRNTFVSYNINSTLNIFNGLNDLASLKATLERRDGVHASLTWAKQQIAIDVTQSFYQVILDQEILEIVKKNLEASQSRLKLLNGQTEVGSASPADLTRQQSQTSTDDITVIQTEARLRKDQLNLLQKLRLESGDNYEFITPSLTPIFIPEIQEHESQLVSLALSHREDLKGLEAEVRARDWEVTAAKSDYYPKINLVFSRNAAGTYLYDQYLNGNNVLPTHQRSLILQLGHQVNNTVGVTLTWNLFDHFLTRLGTQQARVRFENTQLSYDDLRLQISREIRQIKTDYLAAQKQVKSAEVALNAAEKAYATIQGRYQVGSSNFIDLLTAQSTLTQARSSLAQERINLKLQEKLFFYYLGNAKL